jgi:hypothetical protein
MANLNDWNNTPNQNPPSSGMKLDGRTLLIGAIILIGALFILPRLLNTDSIATNPPVNAPLDNPNQQLDPNVTLGQPVAATGVDRDGCATGASSAFRTTDSIYVVAPNSTVPAGTSVFVRLYRNGQPIEDAPEITADQAYTNTCVNFVFEPVDGPFQAGNYEAEFIINGNAADTVTFSVQ